jgi:hypothetical protein
MQIAIDEVRGVAQLFLPETTVVTLGEPGLAARATRRDFLRRTGADSMSLDTRETVG